MKFLGFEIGGHRDPKAIEQWKKDGDEIERQRAEVSGLSQRIEVAGAVEENGHVPHNWERGGGLASEDALAEAEKKRVGGPESVGHLPPGATETAPSDTPGAGPDNTEK